MKHKSDITILAIVTPLVALFALSLDFYIPIVPLLRQHFEVSRYTMQLTLSGFMLCCAISQVLIGPLCDRFGRQPIALYSLTVFMIGTITCLHHPSFHRLLIARLLQAFGSSGTFLAAYTTIRDLYPEPDKSTKMYSYINVCIAQSSIFAPSIGGIISDTFHWEAVFLILNVTGILAFLSTFFFYEETAPTLHPIHYHHLKRSYRIVLRNRNFQVYSLAAATGMGSFFMFFSQSPYIIIDTLHYTKFQYGLFFGIVGLSFFSASLCTNNIAHRIGNHHTVELGSALMAMGGFSLILCQYLFGITITGFILPMMAIVSGAALNIGSGLSGTMSPFGNIAGIAFSAIGFTKFILSAALGLVLSKLDIEPYILGSIITCFATTTLILCILCKQTLEANIEYPIVTPVEYE